MRFSTRALLLLTACTAMACGFLVGVNRMIVHVEREYIRQNILDGAIDPERYKGNSYGNAFVTDEEIDAIVADRDRLASQADGP